MLGVSTTGNATLIAYDDKPILATDPWFGDNNPAYFGSWRLTHRIPPQCKRDILDAKYIWFSHGHPDHLNTDSLQQIRGKPILLADHVGGRIAHDLREQGFEVTILPDRQWVDLSPRIRAFCITTRIQDSVLLLEVNKRLFVNLNDASISNATCTLLVRKIVAEYKHTYMLSLCGYGDADMINFYDENGNFIVPPASQKHPVGLSLSVRALSLGILNVIPFSSFHAYQRTDSIWAQNYTTPLDEYSREFDHKNHNFIPPFSHIDCVTGEVTPLNPESMETVVRRPEEFGDNWSDVLEHGDLDKLSHYFRTRELVRDYLSFINFRVGGRDNFIALNGKKGRGITFEVPRNSLMAAIDYEIFDDLLIGNFMKTTLHEMGSLYEGDFSFVVAKFGDNGRAKTHREVDAYLREYRRRAGADWYYDLLYQSLLNRVRSGAIAYLPRDSAAWRIGLHVYRLLVAARH
jgi:hypothetical protein